MKYWLHRISNGINVSYPLLDNGWLSIGYSDFANKEFLQKLLQDDGWMKFLDDMDLREFSWFKKYRARYNLWYFVTDMKIGDIVVVPKKNGEFSICEIIGDATIISDENVNLPNDWNGKKVIRENKKIKLENSNEFIDIGYVRKVKILANNLSRRDNADSALTSRMKMRQTTADISDLENSIKNARSGKKADLSMALEKASQIFREEILEKLNPDKFENLIKWYFDKIGAAKTDIPPKNRADKQDSDDVDVIAVFDNIKTVINVQGKFFKGIADDWAVQQITAYANLKSKIDDDYFGQYWVISTADDYSDKAKQIAIENNIRLINGIEFAQMLLSAGLDKIEF